MGAFTKFKKVSGKEISEKYQFIQIFLTLIALIHAWTLQYKTPDSTPSLLNRISFIVEDAPWMPPGLKSEAILHLHHFGDWTLGIGYALTSNPYSQDLEIPAPVPPFGLVVMKLFALVGFQISYLIFVALTMLIWVSLVNKLFNEKTSKERLVILFFFVAFAAASIFAVDRGAAHLFLIGLIGHAYILFDRKRYIYAFLCILVAASFKPYMILMLLWAVRKGQISRSVKAFAAILIINLLSLLSITGNLYTGLIQYFRASNNYANEFIIPWITDGASPLSFVFKTIESIRGNEDGIAFLEVAVNYSGLIGISILTIFLPLIINKKIPEFVAAVLLLSLNSLVIPASMAYTLVWGSLGALIFMKEIERYPRINPKINLALVYFTAILLLIVITPYFGQLPLLSGGARKNVNQYFYIIPLSIIVVLSYISILQKKRKQETN
jgi:hypothetical protein